MNAARQVPEIPRDAKGDWAPEYIHYRLRLAGWSWSKIARAHGWARRSPADVLRRKWLAVELAVGEIVGVDPAEIWPSRKGARRNRLEPDRRQCPDRRRAPRRAANGATPKRRMDAA